MAMQIKVTRTSGKVLDEDNQDIESRKAKFGFFAQLSNVGEKSIYDGAIALSCDCPIDIIKNRLHLGFQTTEFRIDALFLRGLLSQ